MKKKRIDQLVVERELAESWVKARALILAGDVVVDDQRMDKPGALVKPDAILRLKNQKLKYVGRGGLKLEHALKFFKIDPTEKICLDVGASTGGFTDCLLQHGAKKVYAVDVGTNQLAWELRKNSKVVVLEKQNFRHLNPKLIADPIEIAVIDVSFISLKHIFPPLKKFLAPEATIIALVKPQFEVAQGQVGKKGVVTDQKLQEEVCKKIQTAGEKEGWKFLELTPSPILGAEGNQEFLLAFIGVGHLHA